MDARCPECEKVAVLNDDGRMWNVFIRIFTDYDTYSEIMKHQAINRSSEYNTFLIDQDCIINNFLSEQSRCAPHLGQNIWQACMSTTFTITFGTLYIFSHVHI